ncbi:MAG: hypothetical protein DHS20C21_01240 [Gemmatimonadota bacterium]|nr:MAG: hypothetical protein DHS20C21_01240 [Gemmatimonadota bacterium]
METIKVACWNIYFSDRLVKGNSVNPDGTQKQRASNVARIIEELDPDLLGIVECMPKKSLSVFLKASGLDYYDYLMEGTAKRHNVGLLYWPGAVKAEKLSFSGAKWKDLVGNDENPKTYAFSRKPLIVKVTPKSGNKNPFLLAVVHQKSKKTYTADEQEPYNNRKKIIAQGRRLRKILWGMLDKKVADRFMIIGDINDGPGFDQYEKSLVESGVEAHLGTVLEPETSLHSFTDLSSGGIPTHPFKPAAQIDHILYPHNFAHGSTKPKVKKNSGNVRTDLVSIKKNGKDRDSDHCPVEVTVLV